MPQTLKTTPSIIKKKLPFKIATSPSMAAILSQLEGSYRLVKIAMTPMHVYVLSFLIIDLQGYLKN